MIKIVVFFGLMVSSRQDFFQKNTLFGKSFLKVSKLEFFTDDKLLTDDQDQGEGINSNRSALTEMIDFFQTIGFNPQSLLQATLNSDISTLRKVKTFFRDKIGPVVSPACIGDMLYFSDSLIEYALARSDLSKTCLKPSINTANSSEADCSCADRMENQMDSSRWTIDVLDSFGKFPSGLLYGNFWFTGDFEQCVDISAFKSSKKHKWNGRYCRLDFSAHDKAVAVNVTSILDKDFQSEIMSQSDIGEVFVSRSAKNSQGMKCSSFIKMKFGTCFPKSCSKSDVQSIVGIAVNFPQRTAGKQIICDTTVTCHDELDIREDYSAVALSVFLIFIVLLILFGTCYDYSVHRKVIMHLPKTKEELMHNKHLYHSMVKETRDDYYSRQSNFIKIALSFSLYSNGKKIFSMKQKPGQIHCLHGLRALSLLWIILAHTYYWSTNYINNPLAAFDLPLNFFNQIILNSTISVDVFYILSATLLVFLWMKEMKKSDGKKVMNKSLWSMMYIHRYIRLTPVYIMVMLIDVFLIRYLTDGPMWNQNGIEPNFCTKNWWTNLLYINNFIGLDEQCMTWTWYLANDMQFFVLSPPILILLYKFSILGLSTIVGILFVTSFVRMSLIMFSTADYPPISIFLNDESKLAIVEDFWNDVYVKPYCRCGPYLVGLLLGYALFKTNLQAHLSRKMNLLGWLGSAILGFGILFGLYDYSKTAQISVLGKAIYGAFARPFWALALSWVIFSCSNGYGGEPEGPVILCR
uniref:Nose resistant-to-fluoxetine protein N-terminal domain-containing protein n=1 Tax=Romanomermis culicivorax TaxID=13658 RepID=A0A915HNX0_ROMCU